MILDDARIEALYLRSILSGRNRTTGAANRSSRRTTALRAFRVV